MFGSHLSIAGGMYKALDEAHGMGMDCLQVFTKNQRQFKSPPLTPQAIRLWQEAQKRTGIRAVVSHASYLINMASPDSAAQLRAVAMVRHEIERCEALGIPFLVIHPGAHMGDGESAGLRRIARCLESVHRDLPGYKTLTCLENTAGSGTTLGWRLEHLHRVIGQVRQPQRMGVCLDTCHALAAGYDLTSASGAKGFLQEGRQILGQSLIKAWHLNDSMKPMGSRVDRHTHVGQGFISTKAFGEILKANPGMIGILETPKGLAPNGRCWDRINLARLKRLAS